MGLYRIDRPAYFNVIHNEERPATTVHMSSDKSRDEYIANLTFAGCTEFTVTELTQAEYRAVARALFPKREG